MGFQEIGRYPNFFEHGNALYCNLRCDIAMAVMLVWKYYRHCDKVLAAQKFYNIYQHPSIAAKSFLQINIKSLWKAEAMACSRAFATRSTVI